MAATPQRHMRAVPSPHVVQERIATSVVALADIAGIRHADLAAAADIEPTQLSKALRMKRKLTLEETERLAQALDAPVTVLFEGGDELRRRAKAGVLSATPAPTPPEGGDYGLPDARRAVLLPFRARRSTPVVAAARAA